MTLLNIFGWLCVAIIVTGALTLPHYMTKPPKKPD